MRLANLDTVDFLGLEKETGDIVLTLVDDCDWEDERQHLTLLQNKINRYFDFIDSGEVYDEAGRVLGRKIDRTTRVKLSILAQYEPVGEGVRFLQHVEGVAQAAKVIFAFKVLAE